MHEFCSAMRLLVGSVLRCQIRVPVRYSRAPASALFGSFACAQRALRQARVRRVGTDLRRDCRTTNLSWRSAFNMLMLITLTSCKTATGDGCVQLKAKAAGSWTLGPHGTCCCLVRSCLLA